MRILAISLLAACGGDGPSPEAPPPADARAGATITVIHQARVDGEIEPCG